MNRISDEKKKQILSLLVEGNSIRSTERITGAHTTTITNLLKRVGRGCEVLLAEKLRDLHIERIELDEMWTFVYKKELHLPAAERKTKTMGDQYLFISIDSKTKLVPTFEIGKRDVDTTRTFVKKLKNALAEGERVQIITDGFRPYIEAIDQEFGADVDFAQLVKVHDVNNTGAESVLTVISGDPQDISTSIVERQNGTVRTFIKRFTRCTNAFSKKLENLRAAVALHFMHYNFMRIHQTLRMTPAMEAGITSSIWNWNDVLPYEAIKV